MLIGSWKDTSDAALHFTMLENGIARSDNMQTLLYKTWKLTENQITFTIESIGNGSSFTDTVLYEIDKLNENELVLKQGTSLFKYIRNHYCPTKL